MRKFLGLVRRLTFKPSIHIRVLISLPKDPSIILLVRNTEGDGDWHLPGGRTRKKKQTAAIRSATGMVKAGLQADLRQPVELLHYKKGEAGANQIIVVAGEAAVDLFRLSGGHKYRWYTILALLQNPKVDQLTKHAVQRLLDQQCDSRGYSSQIA